MKVDEPKFDSVGILDTCKDCPSTDEGGAVLERFRTPFPCAFACPTPGTYDEACALAEKEPL